MNIHKLKEKIIVYVKVLLAHMAPISNPMPPTRMKKSDWGLFLVLMAVLSVLAFTNLGFGRGHVPTSAWRPPLMEFVLLDFGEVTEITSMQFYNGHPDNLPFMISISENHFSWMTVYTSSSGYTPFQWGNVYFPDGTFAKYLEIRPFGVEGFEFYEVAFRGANGELLPPPTLIRGGETAYRLFDEQHLVPENSSFKLGIYFDETHHVRTAYDYLHGRRPTEWTHPPLGKVFIALGIKLFGMNPFAWRLPGVMFGLAMIPLIYAFARQIFKSNNWALFAAIIFGFDFMRFTQTRIGTIDTFVTLFAIAMYFFMYLYISGEKARNFIRSAGLLLLCGASMGFAIASKWQGIYAAVGLPILFFPVWYEIFKADTRKAIKTVGVCVVAFIIMPLTIYVLSYIPFVKGMGGEGIADGLRIIWENQVAMLSFHGNVVSDHPYGSQWWSWPITLIPFVYYAQIADGMMVRIVATGNPAIWWVGIPVAVFVIFRLIKPCGFFRKKNSEKNYSSEIIVKPTTSRDYTLTFLLVGYAMQFLPWIFVSRETYIYHYFPSVPFVVLLITWFFKNHVKHLWVTIGYAAVVIGLFVVFYPGLSGTPVAVDDTITWFRFALGIVIISLGARGIFRNGRKDAAFFNGKE